MKKEKVDRITESVNKFDHTEEMRQLENEKNEIVELKQDVKGLKERIAFLTTLITKYQTEKQQNRPETRDRNECQQIKRKNNNTKDTFQCYNCKRNRHIAEYCKLFCSFCSSSKQNSANCSIRNQIQRRNRYEKLRNR